MGSTCKLGAGALVDRDLRCFAIDESSTCSYIVVLETCSPPMPPAPERAPGVTSCLVSAGQAAALESAGGNPVFALLDMDLGSDGSDPGRAPGGSDQNRL
jgi:hypothetical protein